MPSYVIGDLHGYVDVFLKLLCSAGLSNDARQWTGGDSHLWLIGDLVDRGPTGLDCIELVMSLQEQAARVGGKVQTILGNHELMLLCAARFGQESLDSGLTVMDQWVLWGGIQSDLEGLSEKHIHWLESLPLLDRHGSTLMMHADAMMYVNYGHSIEEVNHSFRQLINEGSLEKWLYALTAFTEHRTFSQLAKTGVKRAEQVLKLYGADTLIHGHTPVSFAKNVSPALVTSAWTYAGGLCTNVDPGIYMGGPGFVYRIDETP